MEFSNINKKTTFGLIILLIMSQYTISYSLTERRLAEYDSAGNRKRCTTPTCYRGTHVNSCTCQSNEWMCAEFNSSTLSCEKCKNTDIYEISEDEEQGDYCKVKGTWIALIFCSIIFFFLCCIGFSCRRTIVNYPCCKDRTGLFYKFFFNWCLCYENCFKCYVCFSEEGNTAVCYCYNCCFTKSCALGPQIHSRRQVAPVNHAPQQRQLYAPQGMPQSRRSINQVMPGNPIVVNDNRIPIVPINQPNAEPVNLIDSAYGQQYQYGMVPNNQNFGIPMQKSPIIPKPDQTIQKAPNAYQENNSITYYNPPMENINVDNQFQYPVIDNYAVNSNNINLED